MTTTERKKRVENDIDRYGSGILGSEAMRKAFEQKHHLRSTVGEHSCRVARTGVKICHILEKLNIPVDVEAVVVGSLCHDLGIVGRDEKYSSVMECYRNHPEDSVVIARELVGDLPEKTEEIIRRHMWPMRKSKIPDSLEGFVVFAADKICSVTDLVKGTRPSVKKPKE